MYGAAPIARARIEEALRRFGPVFLQLFGQSECPNFATTLAKEDHHDPSLLASCGQPCPGVEAAELLHFCRSRLAKYKVPKGFTPVETLPTTPYGKVDKKALRADWLGDHMGEKA